MNMQILDIPVIQMSGCIVNMYLILPLFMFMYHCIFMYNTRHGMSMIHNTGLSRSKIYSTQITKRCLKNFNEDSWNLCLSKQDWSNIKEGTDINSMVKVFNENMIPHSPSMPCLPM